jgi:polyhydroxyalkanoate synthesis regulator phasin
MSTPKNTISQVINQAKESLKLLETLEKETLAKARSFVKLPNSEERLRATNDKILQGLRKLGVATQAEVDELRARVESLEAQLGGGESTKRTPTPTA